MSIITIIGLIIDGLWLWTFCKPETMLDVLQHPEQHPFARRQLAHALEDAYRGHTAVHNSAVEKVYSKKGHAYQFALNVADRADTEKAFWAACKNLTLDELTAIMKEVE